jgi:CheY-like chemotaxis protein
MTRTILLADDSVTIQKVIELTFMEEDYEVVAASDGDEALERLEESTPDIVIADVHMPGASGIDVCRRSKELFPEVPVLLLVGTFEPFDEGAARAAGADAHLKKPFDSQELIQLVGDLMGPPEGAAEPEAEDTWGFGTALEEPATTAAVPAGAAPAPEPEPEPEAEEALDWGGALEPLPEEEAPAAAAQAEEPAPAWERQAEAAPPAGGEPFRLEPVAPSGRAGEVFDLHAQVPAEELAEAGAGAPPEDRGGAERWGFALDEPEAGAGAAAADTGWEEIEEPAAAAGDLGWGEPESESPPGDEPMWEPPGEEAPLAAAEPSWEEPAAGEPLAEEPPWGEPAEAEPDEEWAAGGTAVAEPVPGSGTAYGGARVAAPEPEEPAAAAAAPAAASGPAATGGLSEHDVDRIARRVAELLGERVTREVAWEVVPDLAEVVIRERLRELEGQID